MRALAIAFLAFALTGCRFNVQRLSDGDPIAAEKIVALEPGTTTLDGALALLGAPTSVAWTDDEDVLLYDSQVVRSSRWQVENPTTFIQMSPTSLIGESVKYVAFVATRSGITMATRLVPLKPSPVGFDATDKPLTLNGDEIGRELLRLFFERKTGVLERLEVHRGRPEAGVGGIAKGTFLH